VRDARASAGLTQEGLATRAHVSRRWVADLESGKPGVELGKVLRVLAVLDVDLETSERRTEPAPDRPGLDAHLDDYGRGGP
jgi:y4mF family transcriptional regulator